MTVQLNPTTAYKVQIDTSPSTSFDGQPLSFDVLLQMLILKLGAMDKNIEDLASSGDKNAKIQGAVNKINGLLRDHAGGIHGDSSSYEDIEAAYADAINAAGADSDLGKRLQTELASFRETANDKDIDSNEMSHFSDNVKDIVTDLGTANQQALFALQNAATERTQFIQTLSNLFSTMSQASATTINNIK